MGIWINRERRILGLCVDCFDLWILGKLLKPHLSQWLHRKTNFIQLICCGIVITYKLLFLMNLLQHNNHVLEAGVTATPTYKPHGMTHSIHPYNISCVSIFHLFGKSPPLWLSARLDRKFPYLKGAMVREHKNQLRVHERESWFALRHFEKLWGSGCEAPSCFFDPYMIAMGSSKRIPG